jgi:acyl-coenzyme A synthetase/AMP-(fatty) acid ligase
VPGYEAELADTGELLVTGDTAALYYEGDDEKTKRTFDGDTVRTGDLFERDDDGFFWYRGRVDDLIKVGGIWVAPAEIEHCLVGHPDVVECAVVGAAQNGLTIPRAYVVAREPVEEQALQDFVRERLSPHKYPREVVFVDELPKTPSGKLDRKALAA